MKDAASAMVREIPSTHSICFWKGNEPCYRSTDGRFLLRNTWSIDTVREPNWLLTDKLTGFNYRFFVRIQAERKMETLLDQTDSAVTGGRKNA